MFCSVLTRTRMFSLALALLGLTVATPGSARDFEVWLVDQSNSLGKTYGGTIYIYAGSDLNGAHASSATPTDVLDLGGATAARCLAQTGANPVRAHMLSFNATHSHAILTFVASGHVVVFEAATRTPVACVRTSVGAGGQRQAHAAQPTPDDSYILVANQNGKRLDRITTNYATNTFVLDATLDLANGVTPNGVARELAGVRPDNAPILVVPDATSTLAFVTLRGGGLFVVDPTTTPMEILAEYDKTTVHANGFGGVEANGRMYINSGAGAASTNPSQFDVYRFPLSGYAASNPPNSPAPVVVFSDDTVPPAHERDAHGLVATKHNRYIWVLDRALAVAEVFDSSSDAHVNTIDLDPLSDHLTPDLADISPSGHRIFVSLRGPNPLSGSPHAATGSTPGLGVIQVEQGGKGGVLKSVVELSNVDAAGVERADCHGIRVRLR